jgi:hypothetical protein
MLWRVGVFQLLGRYLIPEVIFVSYSVVFCVYTSSAIDMEAFITLSSQALFQSVQILYNRFCIKLYAILGRKHGYQSLKNTSKLQKKLI